MVLRDISRIFGAYLNTTFMNKTITRFCEDHGLHLIVDSYRGTSRKGYRIATEEDGVIATFRPWSDRSHYKWGITFWGEHSEPRVNEFKTFFAPRITTDILSEIATRIELREFYTHKRRAVRVRFSDGNSLVTEINGSVPSIRAYYRVGKQFNLGEGEHDNLCTVEAVEFLNAEFDYTEASKQLS